MKTIAKKFGNRYPWERWFAKDKFTLRRGRDYVCKTFSMAQQVRQAAGEGRYNVKVNITVADDEQSLTVVVTKL